MNVYFNTVPEREYSTSLAEKYFIEALINLGLTYSIEEIDETPFTTPICRLYCKTTKIMVAEGCGKGLGEQSYISAKFEALEHYTSLVTNVGHPYIKLSVADFIYKELKTIDCRIPPELFDKKFPLRSKPLPWIAYENYKTKEKVYLPAITTHPNYIKSPYLDDNFYYQHLYPLETTNGMASGCTLKEALVHAISEILERDSYSLFLIRTFLKKSMKKINFITETSLPRDLRELLNKIEVMTSSHIKIIYMENELSFPSFCAVMKKDNLPFLIKGFGASLNPAYAIERALLEMLQGFHLDKEGEIIQISLDMLKQWPDLQSCVRFEVFSQQNQRHISFTKTFNNINLPNKLDNYLNLILDKIYLENFNFYYNIVYQTKNFFTVHAIIPETEDFFVIDKGLLNPPKKRGIYILTEK